MTSANVVQECLNLSQSLLNSNIMKTDAKFVCRGKGCSARIVPIIAQLVENNTSNMSLIKFNKKYIYIYMYTYRCSSEDILLGVASFDELFQAPYSLLFSLIYL